MSNFLINCGAVGWQKGNFNIFIVNCGAVGWQKANVNNDEYSYRIKTWFIFLKQFLKWWAFCHNGVGHGKASSFHPICLCVCACMCTCIPVLGSHQVGSSGVPSVSQSSHVVGHDKFQWWWVPMSSNQSIQMCLHHSNSANIQFQNFRLIQILLISEANSLPICTYDPPNWSSEPTLQDRNAFVMLRCM